MSKAEIISLLGTTRFNWPDDAKTFRDSSAGEERAITEPFGRLETSYTGLAPSGTSFTDVAAGTVRQFDMRIDPSLNATIDSIDGDGLLSKLKSLADFTNNLEENLENMHIGKVSSYLRMLGFLSDAAREYEDASAGTVFETFLAAMGKGIIIGGESAATDTISFKTDGNMYGID